MQFYFVDIVAPVNLACINSTCADGHEPTASELCDQCLPGYASQGRGQKCTKCPEDSETGLLYFGAILLAVILFCFLVWDNLEGANDMLSEVEATNDDTNNVDTITLPFHSIVI